MKAPRFLTQTRGKLFLPPIGIFRCVLLFYFFFVNQPSLLDPPLLDFSLSNKNCLSSTLLARNTENSKMEPTKPSSVPSTNPPSVEVAYKRKCIALKKRLGEIEDENELMRVRNKRGWQYIQKMRLESCILLERLAESTGMANELDVSMGGSDAEYDRRLARATARMKYGNLAASGNGEPSYLGDETEGSSEEQPLTVRSYPYYSYYIHNGRGRC